MAAATLGTATAWILTYLIHSSLLIGLALILSRRLGERRLALQEMLIRAAVVGAIATSTIQFSADIRPYSGRFDISGASTRDAAAPPPVFDLVSPIAAAPAATLTAPAAIPTPPLAVVARWELGFVAAWLIGAIRGPRATRPLSAAARQAAAPELSFERGPVDPHGSLPGPVPASPPRSLQQQSSDHGSLHDRLAQAGDLLPSPGAPPPPASGAGRPLRPRARPTRPGGTLPGSLCTAVSKPCSSSNP